MCVKSVGRSVREICIRLNTQSPPSFLLSLGVYWRTSKILLRVHNLIEIIRTFSNRNIVPKNYNSQWYHVGNVYICWWSLNSTSAYAIFHHLLFFSMPCMANAKHVEFSGQTQPARKLVFKAGAGMCWCLFLVVCIRVCNQVRAVYFLLIWQRTRSSIQQMEKFSFQWRNQVWTVVNAIEHISYDCRRGKSECVIISAELFNESKWVCVRVLRERFAIDDDVSTSI